MALVAISKISSENEIWKAREDIPIYNICSAMPPARMLAGFMP